MAVRDVILDAIRARGPIRFDEYMELALYGEGGYYEEPPVGADGDFVTSPHVHPVFAELVADAIVELHGLLGEPEPFVVTEVGAGDGTLARQLHPRLESTGARYVAVERSAGARRSLAAVEGVTVAEDLPAVAHVVIANELLDNLPFRRFRGTDDGAREVRIDAEGDGLVERLVPPDDASDDAPAVAAETELLVPSGAFAFIDRLAARLAHPGYALLIDYGGVGEPGGTAHGYRGHRPVEDLLDRPGATDITAGVDLGAIADRAEHAGLLAFPPVTQRHALTALGFDRWIHDELRRQADLLDRREGLEAVRTWSGRSRATLLVDPAALGRLLWLLLATPGSPAASWV
jgi:SAM-dependent MidA family methyltransferase